MVRRLVGFAGLAVIMVLAVIQTVPYGRDHTNPPVRAEPRWDSARTRQPAGRACFDCHSNETSWPWYASVAPVSWLVQSDVHEGRRTLNFSEWDRRQKEARESAETLREGEMPPWFYAVARPEAWLSPAERDELARGLDATLGTEREGKERPAERE